MRTLLAWMLAGCLCGCSLLRNLDDLDAGSIKPGRRPPEPSAAAIAGDGPGHTYAVTRMLLGHKDWFGHTSIDAWESIGYDLDGFDSLEDPALQCKLGPQAQPKDVFDGQAGIDNQLGNKALLYAFESADPGLETDIRWALEDGDFTLLFRVDALGDQPSYVGLGASVMVATEHTMTASGMQWSPAGDPPLLQVADAYVTDHVFVATSQQPLRLVLLRPPQQTGEQASRLELLIERPIITMQLSPDRTSVFNGVIAGVVEVDSMVRSLRELVANIPLPCAIDEEKLAIHSAVDIMADGVQDPSSVCDGVSVGIGFEAAEVTTDGMGTPLMPLTGLCPE